jgi:hypothetical protein
MGVSRITLAGLATMVIAGVTGAPGTGDAAAVRARPACDPSGSVTQSISGHISGCLRLGNLAPGPRAVVLSQALSYPTVAVPPSGSRPVEPAVTLTLSPASGRPGTVVTVTGHLSRPLHAREPSAEVCWDGCADGLDFGASNLRWTSRRTFRATLRVPAAPWIEAAPYRVAPLASGTYAIGVDCLRSAVDCDAVTEGSATFRLTVAHPVAWCRTREGCAHLAVTPARAGPGDVVRVTGVAPLSLLSDNVAGFVNVKVERGVHGAQVRFSTHNGARFVAFGDAALTVAAPPRYAAVAPLGQVSDGVPQISADPADPGIVAWCDNTTIAESGPGATTAIPSATARSALKALGFSFRFEQQPECAAVAPLATSTGAPAGLAAAFSVTKAAGAPPFYLAALVTHDNGQTWAPIPVPRGSGPAGFGGFRYAGATVQAVYGTSFTGAPRAYPEFNAARPLSEVASADGQSWSQAPLGCPPTGPCVTFAPFQPGNCAMDGGEQTLLRSTDSGAGFTPRDFPYPVQDCGEAELVATSATSELLVDSDSTYPVLRTGDGGASWHDIAIPRPPARANLGVLPDGSLLATGSEGYSGRWRLLRGGTHAFCTVRSPGPGVQRRAEISPPTVIAGTLWWLSGPPGNPGGAPAVQQIPVASLSC